ncbi:MAG: DUF349 domain-containing protein [Prevotellaceae bacterium]|nr:DUF349 domain-containing protein [Prevotellaceae bacterium]
MKTDEKDKVIENETNVGVKENVVSAESQTESYGTEELNLGEENASENEISVVKNYSLMSQQGLLDELKALVDNFPVERTRKDVEAIKTAFYRDSHDSHGSSEDEDYETDESDDGYVFDPIEEEFRKYLDKYKEKRSEHTRNSESQKEENYRQKLAIIEELKVLIREEENLDITFQKFHDIQNRWKEIAQVPQNHVKDLWDTWHYNVEKFYDYVKINRELRDLDLKRNLEAKNELIREAEALMEYPSVVEAFAQLQLYHDAWREIGPVPREQREPVWERFKDASYKLNKKHQAYFDQLKQERQHNIQMKVDLCERLEKLNQKPIATMKEWQKASEEFSAILEEWQAVGFVPKKENDEIYARFKKPKDEFFNKRRTYYRTHKQEENANFLLKKELCEQARALSSSDNWKETTEALIGLQKQWQQIGPVNRKYSNPLWHEFREACNVFFKRKSEYFANNPKELPANFKENLKEKEALIAELENFVPGKNSAANIKILQQFRKRWNDIGFVPIRKKEKIQERFSTLMDEKYKASNISDSPRNKPFRTNKTETYANRPYSRPPASEREQLFGHIVKLENEIALLENNMGFFASSKNADSLIAGIRKKIEATREEIRGMEEQIKRIDQASE